MHGRCAVQRAAPTVFGCVFAAMALSKDDVTTTIDYFRIACSQLH